ncbi:MAG: SDR family NAD(P)-dependent oxidoreductase [Patescibacteria group bacterium]
MNNAKVILLTGGAGFIGSHLAKRLINEGYSVICLDNFSDFYSPALKEDNIKKLKENPNFILVRGDILDRDLLEKIFAGGQISKIVHLAAIPGVRQSIKDPFSYIDVDIKGTVNLLEMAKKYQISRFIFASSSTVYGQDSKTPFSEEEKNLIPISPYGASKLAAEEFCRTYNKLYKIPITVLRYFAVYGPKQRPELALYKFTRLAKQGKPIQRYGSGESARDYTYIDDIVDGTMMAVEKKFDFEIFNLGNSNPTKLKDLIGLLGKKLGITLKIEELPDQLGDVPLTYADISKGKKLLGWEPKVSLEQGIEKFLAWHKEYGNI